MNVVSCCAAVGWAETPGCPSAVDATPIAIAMDTPASPTTMRPRKLELGPLLSLIGPPDLGAPRRERHAGSVFPQRTLPIYEGYVTASQADSERRTGSV